MRTTVAVLPFVLVAVLVTPATARRRVTLACYDGQAGVVASHDGVAQVVSYPRCDIGAEADGVCNFAFPCQSLIRLPVCPPCCAHSRRVRVGHRKRYRGAMLRCLPPQVCTRDEDCIQPPCSSSPDGLSNRCVVGRCQRDPACPF